MRVLVMVKATKSSEAGEMPPPELFEAMGKYNEELVAAGHHGELKPWDAFWGQRYACVQDPDGNGVDLFAPLDRP